MRGSYVLITRMKKDSEVGIGKLGKLNFKKGFYCYVGSAMGKSMSLENRVKRHFRKEKKIRWHIDYLLANPNVSIEGVVLFPSKKRMECFISQTIEKHADETISRFGSSDCNCKGHLHYFRKRKKLLSVLNSLK